jgi:hypothetical protein
LNENDAKKAPPSHVTVGGRSHPLRLRFRNLRISGATALLFIAVFASIGVYLLLGSHADAPVAGSITNFTDPSYFTNATKGRSFWAQPARGYMNTVPATTMLTALGTQYAGYSPAQQGQIDHLLADSGYRSVRIGMNWSSLSYTNPTQFNPNALANDQAKLLALKANGLRPLITLMAYDFDPAQVENLPITFIKAPKVGDTTVQVDHATAVQIVPGRSGLNKSAKTASVTMSVLFTSVSPNGTVTLSKPIQSDTVLNGKFNVSRFAPFQKPFLADGVTPNPAFTETMKGWLQYVKTVCDTTKATLGNDKFDLEIWNELLGNHAFLSTSAYYNNKPPDAGYKGNVQQQILAQTGAYIANPANGLTDVQVTNGFASQVPWPAASNMPNGITALSKHAYIQNERIYPADIAHGAGIWQNALGQKDNPVFSPNYVTHFPEVYLTGVYDFENSELKDMSPITTYMGNTAHGTNAVNQLGQRKQLWETESGININIDPQGLQAVPNTPAAMPVWDRGTKVYVNSRDANYILGKGYIRYLASYINKGMTKIYNGINSYLSADFITAIQNNPNIYPGDAAGGQTMQIIGRFMKTFSGAQPITRPRNLSLQRLDDYSGNIQFKGDGTAAHPTLYDRDLFGFFPYQMTNNSFLIPVYVQTSDIEKIYTKHAPDPTQFDQPAATYRLTIGGVNGLAVTSTSLYDPLTDQSFPVNLISKAVNNIVIEIPVTDSPRMLSITECSTNCGSGGGGGQHKVVKPTIKFTTPTTGQMVSGNVTVQTTATTDPSTSVANVLYELDGQKLAHNVITTAPYTYTLITKNIGSGLHTLSALVQDGYGNTALAQIQIVVAGGVAPPTVTISNINGGQNISSPITIQAIASADPSTSVASVQYLLDQVVLGPPLKKSPYAFVLDPSKFTAGGHRLSALVTDGDGNTHSSSIKVVFK